MNKVITLSRQFGSGGREVGKRLSDILNIPFYDKEIIQKIAQKTNLDPEYIQEHQEHSSFFQYPITFGRTFSMPYFAPSDTIQIEQTNLIKSLGQSPCIIVGRCANHILFDQAFKVFIYSSDMDKRIQRCYDKVPEDKVKSKEEMKKSILAVDKQRAKYNEYYTGYAWMDITRYNLLIDTAKMDVKKAAQLIAQAVQA